MDTSTAPAASTPPAAPQRAWWLTPPRDGNDLGWPRLLLTVPISAAMAIFFSVLWFVSGGRELAARMSPADWALLFGRNFAVSLVIGLCIHALFALARRLLGRARIAALAGWQRTAFFSAVPLLGTFIGWPLGLMLVYADPRVLGRITGGEWSYLAATAVPICGLIYLGFSMRYRQLHAEMRANDAQLRLLQGQMEPHFLFNTLANVISLIDADAPRAKQVLEAFTEYLRASLGSLRKGRSTLDAELELATRFLALMQARMGERLRVEIDVPAPLREAALPALLLQPLVENAIKHGLEPQVDGGTVRVVAREIEAEGLRALRLCVEDDGAGLEAAARRRRPATREGTGNGIALANLRERLAGLGPAARLELSAAGPEGGTRACLVLPLAFDRQPA